MHQVTKQDVKVFIETLTDQMHGTMQHEMADTLLAMFDRVDELNQQVVNLAVENSTIKTMNDCLAEELRGYESDGAFDGPDMHKLWHSHAGALPATNAAIANIQAQGVEKFAQHPALGIIACGHIALEFAAQLRKGAGQ